MREISVSISDAKGQVSADIYGQFIEHLGDCVYSGIYDKDSPLSDGKNIRLDVLEKAKELAPPIIRFPGGTVMCIYHWEDAVGPIEQRKKRKNIIWGGVLDPAFGTAEFVDYCRRLNAEPMICVNMASGTPEEAGNWVQYCNADDDSYYANLRRSHGYEKPFNVKYWCIGNECYAEPDIGKQHDVDVYIRDAREFIKFMKLSDPNIKTVIVGSDNNDAWNKPVLDALGDMTDYLSYHYYACEGGLGLYGPFAGEKQFAEIVSDIEALLDTYPQKPQNFNKWYRFPPRQGKIMLMIDEWNIWQYQDDSIYGLHMIYNWRDAIWVSSMLNRFVSDEYIAGCNMAQLCNIIAPIVSTKDSCYEQTIFTPCKLYREKMHGMRKNAVISGQYSIDGGAAGEIEAISASAVKRDGKTYLAVTNRDFANEVSITLPFDADVTLCHADANAVNTMEKCCIGKTEFTVSANTPFILPAGGFIIAGEQ